MATETVTRLVDDLDGGKAERTVAFSWNGKDYSIDLSRRNIAALEKALEPYISAARPGRARATRGRGPSRGAASRRPSKAMDPGAVRVWARANGYVVSERGRIGASVLSAYEAAK